MHGVDCECGVCLGDYGTKAGAQKSGWIAHVRDYAFQTGQTFSSALKDPETRSAYYQGAPPPRKAKRVPTGRKYGDEWKQLSPEGKRAFRVHWAQVAPIKRKKSAKRRVAAWAPPLPSHPPPPLPRVRAPAFIAPHLLRSAKTERVPLVKLEQKRPKNVKSAESKRAVAAQRAAEAAFESSQLQQEPVYEESIPFLEPPDVEPAAEHVDQLPFPTSESILHEEQERNPGHALPVQQYFAPERNPAEAKYLSAIEQLEPPQEHAGEVPDERFEEAEAFELQRALQPYGDVPDIELVQAPARRGAKRKAALPLEEELFKELVGQPAVSLRKRQPTVASRPEKKTQPAIVGFPKFWKTILNANQRNFLSPQFRKITDPQDLFVHQRAALSAWKDFGSPAQFAPDEFDIWLNAAASELERIRGSAPSHASGAGFRKKKGRQQVVYEDQDASFDDF